MKVVVPRVIYTAPLKTSYFDDTTWFYCRLMEHGVLLKPGERIAILPPEDSTPSPQLPASRQSPESDRPAGSRCASGARPSVPQ